MIGATRKPSTLGAAWTGLDADTKMILFGTPGGRDAKSAKVFVADLSAGITIQAPNQVRT
jgi:hypothetical protein